mgnify:CR=1 FL=1
MLFGSGADILPSEAAVWVRLPDAAGSGDGAFSSSDSDEAHEEAEEEEQQQQQGAAGKRQQAQQSARRQQGEAAEAAALDPAAAAAAGAGYAARDGAGAPTPLAPALATLSMLPRTQWQNLVHLDTIKARNKPMEPPTKPAAAPFFLPTLAGVDSGRNPVFDYERPPLGGEADAGADAAVIGGGGGEAAADAALAAKAAAAWGDDADEELGDAEEEERRQDGAADAAAPAGRVLRTRMQAEHSPLVRLLRACGAAGNWTSLVAHLRGLSPVALDSEIRSMQVGGSHVEASRGCVRARGGRLSLLTPQGAAACARCPAAAAAAPYVSELPTLLPEQLPSPPLVHRAPRCWKEPRSRSWTTWPCCCSFWRRRRAGSATLSLCRRCCG